MKELMIKQTLKWMTLLQLQFYTLKCTVKMINTFKKVFIYKLGETRERGFYLFTIWTMSRFY